MKRLSAFIILLILTALLAACGAQPQQVEGPLNLVATTTLVADVVRNVAGEAVNVKVLVPAGVDEHAYEPTAQDMVAISNADVIFYNGAGLEPFMQRLLGSASEQARVVAVSDGIVLQQGLAEEGDHAGEAGAEGGDPHVWTDPNNVMVWTENIARALREADPQNATQYQERASAYRAELEALDQWIQSQVEPLPQERRKLVTDHTIFTYFSSRYGFEQVGAVIPGYSTLASPSAQEIAALEEKMRALGVPVIFTGSSFSPALSKRVAEDTGARLVQIHTGSLTGPDGTAPTYLDYMRNNVNIIVEALKGND